MKLKKKMLLFIGTPVLLVIFMLALVSYTYSKNLLLEESKDILKAEVQKHATEIEAILSQKKIYLDMLKLEVETNKVNKLEIEKELRYLTRHIDSVLLFYMAFENGDYLGGDDWQPDESMDPTQRTWYQEAMATEGIVVSKPYIDAKTQDLVFTLSCKFEADQNTRGVLAVDISLVDIIAAVKSVKIKESGQAFLINSDGTFVAHHDYGIDHNINQIENGSLKKITEELIKNSGRVQEFIFKNIPKFYISQNIQGADWTLVINVTKADLYQPSKRLGGFMLILGLVSLLVIMVIIYFISNSITRPIVRLSDCVQDMVEYDFTLTDQSASVIYSKNKDEIGVISRALIQVKNTMRDIMVELGSISEKVSLASQELSSVSEQSSRSIGEISRAFEDISQGAASQAEDMQRGAMAMDVMQNALLENDGVMQDLNTTSSQVFAANENGKLAISSLIEITEKNKEAAVSVREVIINTNNSAIQIESASDMIKSIADQTNLLALNAAIEAARVGESGKGFAVVAEEIRKLAEQSNSFTQEIKEIVSGLTTTTGEAVEIMNQVGEIILTQNQRVSQTEAQFLAISNELEKNKEIIQNLNNSGQKLEKSKQDLSEIVENLSALSQENAASAQEASASIEEQSASSDLIASSSTNLAEMAGDLANMIGKFKV